MPVPNNSTRFCRLDSGYLTGARLALTLYRPNRVNTPQPRLDTSSPGYKLAASTAHLRAAVNLAVACLRTGRTAEALAVLEAV
jgi:hypothetical protein